MNNKYEKLFREKASCYHKTNPEEKSEDFLMNKACQKVGLYDWGDTNFVAALRKLLNSFREEGGLNSYGWFFIHSFLTRYLCGRLLVQNQVKQYHEIKEEKIKQPLFIIGLPRTGSTLLQRLLSQAPSCRSLLYWEGLFPAPFSQSYTQQGVDPRIHDAEEFIHIRNSVVQNINTMHSSYACQPEECFLLLDKSFISPRFHVLFDLPDYFDWVKKQDMVPVYLYHKQQLQVLQFTTPHRAQQRWILKDPLHLFGINSLLEVFPDACIVQTHRAPLQSLSSLCSMLTTIRKNLQNKGITDQLTKETVLFWKNMLDNIMQVRQKYGAERFLDINYKDLTKDPIGTVHNIYDYFGLTPDETATEKMHEWLLENPKNKHGVHKYSSEHYGLSQEIVDQYFSEYCQRVSV
ncbi:MAG: sulfotransferase [Candidatus Electrothrix scaldis]|nr:MAG: sulfotransferase [Candidatus Electrothrix sp. GW3-3]